MARTFIFPGRPIESKERTENADLLPIRARWKFRSGKPRVVLPWLQFTEVGPHGSRQSPNQGKSGFLQPARSCLVLRKRVSLPTGPRYFVGQVGNLTYWSFLPLA